MRAWAVKDERGEIICIRLRLGSAEHIKAVMENLTVVPVEITEVDTKDA